MDTQTFLQTHPVFGLAQAAEALGFEDGKRRAVERFKHYLGTGRLKLVAREVYATVPPGLEARAFQPDRYLVAVAARPDAVFSHHAALELLGAAHSDWNVCTAFTQQRRPPLELVNVTVRFLSPPSVFPRRQALTLGVRRVDRLGQSLAVTGPERTLLDGFRQPQFVGGLAELVESAAGFGVLDLDLLERLLRTYRQRALWAAAGWFLERHQRTFFVPDSYLTKLERQRPKAAQYLVRSQRGGVMATRWNLILPPELTRGREPNEP